MSRERIFLFFTFFLFGYHGITQQNDTASGQIRFFNKTEAGVAFGIGSFKTDIYNGVQRKAKNDEIVVSLQTVNGVRYNNRWALGLSLGVEKWREGLFWPVYGYLGYNFKRTENTFYANVYLGYGIGTRYATTYYEKGKGAFSMIIGIGYRMKIAKNLRFGYEIFYKYQALKSTYYNIYQNSSDTTTTKNSKTPVDYQFGLHFAGFRILVDFP